MTESERRPFVPRRGWVDPDPPRPPTPAELAEMRAILASTPRPRRVTPKPELSDTERLAIARKRADDERRRP